MGYKPEFGKDCLLGISPSLFYAKGEEKSGSHAIVWILVIIIIIIISLGIFWFIRKRKLNSPSSYMDVKGKLVD